VRHPSAALRRLASALAAALAALAGPSGCAGGLEVPACPGVEVGTFDLVATRTAASCQGDSAPIDGAVACAGASPFVKVDCQTARPVPACCFDRLFPPRLELQAVVAYGALGGAAAFCLQRPGATPYLGTRTAVAGGEALTTSLDTAGAVLASCAATCAVTVRHQVTGLVARDPGSGAVTGFTGQSVEEASATPSADCAACATPCSATWTLAPRN
jgi:hypothetical protein